MLIEKKTDLLSIPSSQHKSIKAECIKGYKWPRDIRDVLNRNIDVIGFEEERLLEFASKTPQQHHFVISFLSREYLKLGFIWATHAARAGIKHFAIVAFDNPTYQELKKNDIPSICLDLPGDLLESNQYRNPGGFDYKAMGLIFTRVKVVKFLVDSGLNVLNCDIDALFFKNPILEINLNSNIVFQRVVYFPKELAKRWGFTVCGGFVAYRSSKQVSLFLERVHQIQHEVSSDQLALNLALLESNVIWELEHRGIMTDEERMRNFISQADRIIRGHIPESKISLCALPATSFWRHDFIPFNLNKMIVAHPNSPKSLDGKLAILSNLPLPPVK